VPVLTLAMDQVEVLGVSLDELRQLALAQDSKRRLEPMLTSRGFDMTRTIYIVSLRSGEGVLITQ
jgi:hypothetical protein